MIKIDYANFFVWPDLLARQANVDFCGGGMRPKRRAGPEPGSQIALTARYFY